MMSVTLKWALEYLKIQQILRHENLFTKFYLRKKEYCERFFSTPKHILQVRNTKNGIS